MMKIKQIKKKKSLISQINMVVKKKKHYAIRNLVLHLDQYSRIKTQKILELWAIKTKTKKIWALQKRLRFLRRQKKSTKPTISSPPWIKIDRPPTRKEHFLNTRYNRYRNLRIKDRIDFFRTYLGQMLLVTEMHSQDDYKNTWFSRFDIKWQTDLLANPWPVRVDYDSKKKHQSLWKTHFFFSNIYKKSWFYENLIQKRQQPQSAKKFVVTRPNTAFQFHWKQKKKELWKETLLFRRALYSGFGENIRKENKNRPLKMKVYLRRKNPRSEKRNRLYHRLNYFLNNYKHHGRIIARRAVRLKQLVRKIIWPFYGHLRLKQMKNIYQKSRRVKSKTLAYNEIILSHYENRLDVVVYRLNLAPTILWARRLIKSGSIFVVSAKDVTLWDSMYASLKKIAFPLKLRDPKKLYSTTLWTNESKHWAKFRFLSCPQKKIAYLLQPGDLIQSIVSNSLHQFKTHSHLWQKQVPKHLLTKKHLRFFWGWHAQEFFTKNYNSWEQKTEPLNSAVFLHSPQFNDLNSNDRIKESFFRWTIL